MCHPKGHIQRYTVLPPQRHHCTVMVLCNPSLTQAAHALTLTRMTHAHRSAGSSAWPLALSVPCGLFTSQEGTAARAKHHLSPEGLRRPHLQVSGPGDHLTFSPEATLSFPDPHPWGRRWLGSGACYPSSLGPSLMAEGVRLLLPTQGPFRSPMHGEAVAPQAL